MNDEPITPPAVKAEMPTRGENESEDDFAKRVRQHTLQQRFGDRDLSWACELLEPVGHVDGIADRGEIHAVI